MWPKCAPVKISEMQKWESANTAAACVWGRSDAEQRFRAPTLVWLQPDLSHVPPPQHGSLTQRWTVLNFQPLVWPLVAAVLLHRVAWSARPLGQVFPMTTTWSLCGAGRTVRFLSTIKHTRYYHSLTDRLLIFSWWFKTNHLSCQCCFLLCDAWKQAKNLIVLSENTRMETASQHWATTQPHPSLRCPHSPHRSPLRRWPTFTLALTFYFFKCYF